MSNILQIFIYWFALLATHTGQEWILKLLLEKTDMDINIEFFGWGDTLLLQAARTGNDKVLKVILEKEQVSLNKTNKNGDTPLHLAATVQWKYRFEGEHNEIVEFLLKCGADVNAENYDDQTPLHIAAKSGRMGIVRILIKHGADVNAGEDIDGWTPIHSAVLSGFCFITEIIICYLVKHGANINTKNTIEPPLHFAVRLNRRDTSIVECLLKCGADINAKCTENGNTPLHEATRFLNFHKAEIVEYLLKNGAKWEVNNKNGKTPFDFAVEEIVELLKRGAKWDDMNKNGKTPLDFALEDDIEIVNIYVKYIIFPYLHIEMNIMTSDTNSSIPGYR